MNKVIFLILAIVFTLINAGGVQKYPTQLIIINGNSSMGDSITDFSTLNNCNSQSCDWLDLYPDYNGNFEAVIKFNISDQAMAQSFQFFIKSQNAGYGNRYYIGAVFSNSSYNITSTNFTGLYDPYYHQYDYINGPYSYTSTYNIYTNDTVPSDQVMYIFIKSNSSKSISVQFPILDTCYSSYDSCWDIVQDGSWGNDDYDENKGRSFVLVLSIGCGLLILLGIVIGLTMYGVDRYQKRRNIRQESDSYHVMSETI